jgi:hypothetical protein
MLLQWIVIWWLTYLVSCWFAIIYSIWQIFYFVGFGLFCLESLLSIAVIQVGWIYSLFKRTLHSITAQGIRDICSLVAFFSKEVCYALHISWSLNYFAQYAASIHVLPWKWKSRRDETWGSAWCSKFCLLMNIWRSDYSQLRDRRKPDVSFEAWGLVHRCSPRIWIMESVQLILFLLFCKIRTVLGCIRVLLVSISCPGLDVVDRQKSGFCWWNSRI